MTLTGRAAQKRSELVALYRTGRSVATPMLIAGVAMPEVARHCVRYGVGVHSQEVGESDCNLGVVFFPAR